MMQRGRQKQNKRDERVGVRWVGMTDECKDGGNKGEREGDL